MSIYLYSKEYLQGLGTIIIMIIITNNLSIHHALLARIIYRFYRFGVDSLNYLFLSLSIFLSIHLSIYLSIYLPIYLSI